MSANRDLLQREDTRSPDELAIRLRLAAELAGSHARCAAAAGISLPQFDRYLAGRVAAPAWFPLIRFARTAGVSLNWLAYGDGPMRSNQLAPTEHLPEGCLRQATEPRDTASAANVPHHQAEQPTRRSALGAALVRFRGSQPIPIMAKRLGVNKNTLGSYERGHAKPDVEFLVRFAEVAGVSLGDLIDLRLQDAGAPITSAQLRYLREADAAPAAGAEEALLRETLKALLRRLGD